MSKLEDLIADLDAIPVKRYCQITGESPNTVHQRKFKGVWKEGVHLFHPKGSPMWVSISAVQTWLRNSGSDVKIVPLLVEQIRKESGLYWTPPKNQGTEVP